MRHAQTQVNASNPAVAAKTARNPSAAATDPPNNGPRKAPSSDAVAVAPNTSPRSSAGTSRPINAFVVGRMPPINNPTAKRWATNTQ